MTEIAWIREATKGADESLAVLDQVHEIMRLVTGDPVCFHVVGRLRVALDADVSVVEVAAELVAPEWVADGRFEIVAA
jgi:hypothetical protein